MPGLITIAAERTFLDKVMILHGWYCGHRDEERLPKDKDRLSRHYYDVATMMETPVVGEAMDDIQLVKDVIKHAELFFKRGWMKLDEIFIDGLKIVPQDKLRKSLERDYNAMQEMLFGDIPPFLSLIKRIEELEHCLNEKVLSS